MMENQFPMYLDLTARSAPPLFSFLHSRPRRRLTTQTRLPPDVIRCYQESSLEFFFALTSGIQIWANFEIGRILGILGKLCDRPNPYVLACHSATKHAI